MKVAHIICTYPPYKGGMGNSVVYLCDSLNRSGCKATVFTPLYSSLVNNDEAGAVRLKPLFKFGNAAILPQLLWRLRSFDIIHLHYPFFGADIFAWLASVIWRIPLVVTYHMDTEAPGLRGFVFQVYKKMFEPLVLSRAAIIIGSSMDYLQNSSISALTRSHPEKITAIPFGFRTNLEKPLDGVIKAKSILFVSSLDKAHYFKGLNILFAALAQIKKAGKLNGWMLEIVGAGDMLDDYQELCAELGISRDVAFLGRVNDEELTRKYREAGMLVLPSTTKGEAFGIVLIEAMASGTPVIASSLPGVRSVFTDKLHGFYVVPGVADSLATAIQTLINDDGFRLRAGQAGREYAMSNYTQAVMTEKILMIYQNILIK